MVVHIQTSNEAVDDFLSLIRELALEKEREGFVRQAEQPRLRRKCPDVYIRPRIQASA